MSPKTRFQILLEPEQLDALRRIQERTSAPVASQIRKAVEKWIAAQGEQTERKRASTRKRS
jgi:Ribbon-helix-helix domain